MMPPRNPNIPAAPALIFSKAQILDSLVAIDRNRAMVDRILLLEAGFRARTTNHIAALPVAGARLQDFNTSPFVLMIYARMKGYARISQIEQDILPAKLFSSMETSAGRMIEDVALSVYGWQPVPSGMHSVNSALDGKKIELPLLKAATLKSGPRCLNDEMSENFADNVIAHGSTWLRDHGATALDFTYGVLYGTKKQSNKKDWHILRNIAEKLPGAVRTSPWSRWDMSFELAGMPATATVRVGQEWWTYLGGASCLMEMCIALIRSCIVPGVADPVGATYIINDVASIVRLPASHGQPNVAILQASQIPWLFFLMRHFCDSMLD